MFLVPFGFWLLALFGSGSGSGSVATKRYPKNASEIVEGDVRQLFLRVCLFVCCCFTICAYYVLVWFVFLRLIDVISPLVRYDFRMFQGTGEGQRCVTRQVTGEVNGEVRHSLYAIVTVEHSNRDCTRQAPTVYVLRIPQAECKKIATVCCGVNEILHAQPIGSRPRRCLIPYSIDTYLTYRRYLN